MKTTRSLLYRLGLALILTSSAATFGSQVTFQVNLSAQAALGAFDPASDAVYVAGDPLNGWSTSESPLAPSPTDAGIWTGTFEVNGTAGATAQYKFVMVTATGTTWEGNVGTGGGTGNRTFTLSDANQTLPVVYFNNVTSGTSVSADITFRVDMSVQEALGNFDPASGTVSVAGEFNSWNATAFELSRSSTESGLWVGTLKVTGAAASTVQYKFVINGGTWEGNVGVGGSQNRALTLSAGAQTLPVVFFNNLLAAPTNISLTFQVNLAVAIAQGQFDPTTGTVSVAGDVLNNWNATASALTRSTTDPNLWTGTFDVTSSAGATIALKYVLNGSTWESIDNRTYTLPGTDPQTLPVVAFNNIDNLGRLTLARETGGKVKVSWTAGPHIRLRKATDLSLAHWQDVPNTEGQDSTTVEASTDQAFFQLTGP